MRKYLLNTVIAIAGSALLVGCSQAEKVDGSASVEATLAGQPNVLLIVADDLGYSDLGAFGGEIDTPNLDALAMSGLRLTNFYAMPNCSPTRSMLLTGKDNHAVGMGAMAEAMPTAFPFLIGRPGYEGYLKPETTTIAEKFSEAGYRTMMTGKWHLGDTPEQQPSEHGFDKSFVLLGGGGDHFGYGQNGDPALEPVEYTQDGKTATYPVGTYSSDFYAEQLIDYVGTKDSDNRPFFAYLAFTAPHWPLQAPQDLIAKYEGRYDAGPEALRNDRLARMKTLGLIENSISVSDLAPLGDWNSLDENQRAIGARKMEIYAAMVDSLDQNVGKVLAHLRATGEYDNTVIIFMSDNGAEGIPQGPLIGRSSNSTLPENKAQVMATIGAGNVDLAKMGTKDSFLTYESGWAQAAMAPFRDYKGYTDDGGIRVPAFIAGPGINGQRITDSLLSVRDIMPTTLDLSDIDYDPSLTTPSVTRNGVNAPTAKSWVPILTGQSDSVRSTDDAMAWELHLRRAVRMGDWKAVYEKDNPAMARNPKAPSSWKLFNLQSDPGESKNVRKENPEVFERLMTAWEIYAEENGVFVPGPKPAAQ